MRGAGGGPDPLLQDYVTVVQRHVDRLVDECIDATCPIYQQNGRGQPEVIGTAIALHVGGRGFLCTAAHVSDRATQGLLVGGAEKIIPLEGHLYKTSVPRDSRLVDKYDVAVFPLSSEQERELGSLRFVQSTDLLLSDLPCYQPGQRTVYLVIGYPTTKQPREARGDVTARPFYPLLNAVNVPYRDFGADESSHLILEFDRKGFADPAFTAPDPHGMSGGGVWRVENLVGPAAATARLVSLAIEYHKPPANVLLTTRMRICLGAIWRHHADLRPALRQLR